MSFSGDTKTALAKIPCERDCCASAELCGMLIFASVSERNKMVFLSETEEAAYLFSGLLIRCLDVCSSPEVFSKGKTGRRILRLRIYQNRMRRRQSRLKQSKGLKRTENLSFYRLFCVRLQSSVLKIRMRP